MEKNKTALVTGAASGLGLEFCNLLAKDKYTIVMVDLNTDKLQLEKSILEENYNIKVITIAQDLSKQESAQKLFNQVKDYTIEVLINNAGFGMFGSFHENNWERELGMLNLHVITTTHLTKLLLKDMVTNGSGKVLNVSSLAAFQPGPLMALYYATKAYVLSFSEAIANELKGTGVTVTAFCPGPTKTLFQKTVQEGEDKGKIGFNMGCPKKVTLYGYKAMHKGKTYAIPGGFNKFLALLPRVLSRNTAANIVRKIQEKNRA
ncbi:SDR family NAD(P)-dependent oxidoreductase [Aurantibacter sp.]|uniref:SDR family NAD(P)-dependent oxidoreductase n=1 Tax=Aurantibacter sp. TaxID=2807103 RepID=UPI0035C816CE